MSSGVAGDLPASLKTRPMGSDPDRYDPGREIAWEVYGPFGRRLGLWWRTSLGTFPPEDLARFMAGHEGRCWVRPVTFKKED